MPSDVQASNPVNGLIDTFDDDPLDVQRRFLAMKPEEQEKAIFEESKLMTDFYARNPEELLPDFIDEPEECDAL